MSDTIIAAIILGVAVLIGSLLVGGRYVANSTSGSLYVVDRFIGTVYACSSNKCSLPSFETKQTQAAPGKQ